MANEFGKLQQRWQNKTGEPMPLLIASLPIDRVRRAVELTEKGITVVVPRETVSVTTDNSDSMQTWDKHNEH